MLVVALYAVAALVIVTALIDGLSYYTTPFSERPHLEDHRALRPAGIRGHAYGLVGSVMILLLLLYSVRKRARGLQRFGTPAQWLEVHISFGIIGPLLIILHTAFKVQGLVAVSFWSMIAVALSGVFGRWLYLQIPRNLAGYEYSRQDLEALEMELAAQAAAESRPEEAARHSRRRARLARKIRRLESVRRVFQWWHVIHKPVAVIMLLIMFVHVGVVVTLGYAWVFGSGSLR